MLQRLERRRCLGHREHPADHCPQLAGIGQPGKLGKPGPIGLNDEIDAPGAMAIGVLVRLPLLRLRHDTADR
jgi:hypothetical protein